MMNTEELENKIFDLLEERGTFLFSQINISRLSKNIWLIGVPALSNDDIGGTGKTKLEALEELYNKLKEE